jgi:actin related protein 2/3 complex subunit 1A/1B
MTTQINRLAVAITAHAWNKDRSMVAICPNNHKILIYKKNGAEWEKVFSLKEHDSVVTSIDWAPNSNRILSCSQDRNAYVWRFEDAKWKPTLVILRINRAATRCKWSPSEDKFAVASGACVVSICYYETENDWWVSKHLKKHDSTVLDVAWHPNSVLVATASSDGYCRVLSAFTKGVDNKEALGAGTAFGSKLPFGTVCKEIPVGAWAQAVKWSPSGNRLAWCTRDSTVHVLECATADHKLVSIKYPTLPFVDLLFVNDNNLIAVGHDYNPTLFQFAGQWKFAGKLDTKGGGAGAKKAGPGAGNISMWQNMDKKGAAGDATETTVDTKHQNCITVIQPFAGPANNLKQFSTSGLDGNVAVWDVPTIEKSAGVKIN